MKRLLKIAGVILLVLLAALLILPFAFRGKLMEVVKQEANSMLDARLDFDRLSLSFIRNFPKATISLQNLSLTGVGQFEGDTLVAADEITVTVNIKSIFSSAGYEISNILLARPRIHAMVLEDGKANWDIMKSDADTATQAVAEDTTSSAFKIILQQLRIENAAVTYSDRQSKMDAALANFNLLLSGDLGAEHTTLVTAIGIDTIDFSMDNIPYLSHATFAANMKVDADLKQGKFTFNQNTVRLNAMEAGIDGWVTLLDNGYDMDIRLNTSKIDFKQLLSLIPAVYAKDFEGLRANGDLQLTAAAKGKMEGDHLPAFDVKLLVNNGQIQYPALPKAIDHIAIDAQVSNAGGSADLTAVEVRKFHFAMAGNPFDIALKVATPVSDAAISGTAKGKIDLDAVKEVYPLDESVTLSGLLTADLAFAARMSQIENEQYENVSTEGHLSLHNLLYRSADLPDVVIKEAALNFTPRYVALNALNVQIGKNDVAATGRLENFIPYVLKDATVKGVLHVQSNYFNANDFMSDEATAETPAADTSAMSAFEVPGNVDFALHAQFKEVVFDNIHLTNIVGNIAVKDGKADLKNLSTNAFAGTVVLNGYYSTAVDPKKPEVKMDINIQNASYVETFKSLDMVKKLAPIFESLTGNYSIKMALAASLDGHLSPNLQTLLADGLLQSKEVKVANVAALDALAKAANNESLSAMAIKDLKLPFEVKDGRLHTRPFDINTGAGKINLSGSTGLDQTINYTGKMDLPETKIGGKPVKLTAALTIGGTFKDPKVSLNTQEMVNEVVTQAVEEAKTEVNEKINEEAIKQAEKLKAEARKAGENLIAEAEKQGKKLIEEANKTKNPIAKIAAVKTAEAAARKLKEEAEKQAQKLIEEAGKQAQNLIDAAVIK